MSGKKLKRLVTNNYKRPETTYQDTLQNKKAMLEITNSLEELRQEYFTEKEETLASISFIKKTLNLTGCLFTLAKITSTSRSVFDR